MAIYKSASGRQFTLNQELGKGGEGAVFAIQEAPDSVGKIYAGKGRTALQERKLRTMLDNPPPVSRVGKLVTIAWPTDILYDNNVFAGYVMPRVGNAHSLKDVYETDTRKRVFPNFTWETLIRIATNFSIAVNNIHETGHVIGDLNPGNALLDDTTGLITLVDTDSYQVHSKDDKTTFNCLVGVAEFLPRELQGVDLGAASQSLHTVASDRFALAVLIFSMLMNGTHPFACRSISTNSLGSNPELRNIREGRCLFYRRNTDQMDIPMTAPDISVLPPYVQQLFKRAFVVGHLNPSDRPAAEEWVMALQDLKDELTTCTVNRTHMYYSAQMGCPWCDIETKLQQTMNTLMSQTTVASQSYGPGYQQPPGSYQQQTSYLPPQYAGPQAGNQAPPGYQSQSAYNAPSSSQQQGGGGLIDYEGRQKYLTTLLILGGVLGAITGAIALSEQFDSSFTSGGIGCVVGLIVNGVLYKKTLHHVDRGEPMNSWYGLGAVLPIVGVIGAIIAVVIALVVLGLMIWAGGG